MDSNAEFELISMVPDYKALEIVSKNRQELDAFVHEIPILKEISKDGRYKQFRHHLNQVETYLKKSGNKLDADQSHVAYQICKCLMEKHGFSKSQALLVLNRLSELNETLLEIMFPATFNKAIKTAILADIQSLLVQNSLTTEKIENVPIQVCNEML